MAYKPIERMITKSIKFDIELLEKIEKLAEEAERDFSQQIRFMCKQYLAIKEK